MKRDETTLKKPWLLPVLLVAYAGLLHWVYEVKIAPLFYYLGSRYRDPDPVNYAFVVLLVLLTSALLPRVLTKASHFILWMLFLMTAVPAALVPQYADIISRDQAFVLAVVVLANFALVVVGARFSPRFGGIRLRVRPDLFWTSIALVTVLVFSYLMVTTGLSLTMIDSFNDTRDIRFGYREAIAGSGGPILGYAIQLQGNVINPLLLGKGFLDRRWWLVGVGIFGQALIFSQTGFKMILLSPFALIAVVWLFQGGMRRGRTLLVGVLGSSLLALVVDRMRGGMLIFTEVFIDRLLLIPGTLTAAHVMVFDNQEKAMWGYSFMAPFVHYPYSTTPAFLVGAQFTGSTQVTANANLFADGFANLGYAGITIEAVVLVLILWLIDSATRHLSMSITCALCLVPTLSLVNSSVFTSLLTGGYGFVVIVAASLRSPAGTRGQTVGSEAVSKRAQPATTTL